MDGYLREAWEAVSRGDFERIASLLWLPIVGNPPRGDRTQQILTLLNLEEGKGRRVPPLSGVRKDYEELFNNHTQLLTTQAHLKGEGEATQMISLYGHATGDLQIFLKIFASAEGNYEIPILKVLCANLYHLAVQTDVALRQNSQMADRLEDTARQLSRCLTLTITDRSPLPTSKRWAAIAMAALLFRSYFRLGTVRLCSNVARALETAMQGDFPPLNALAKADAITYRYYRARLAINQNDFRRAERLLSEALEACQARDTSQKRQLAIYLTLVKMIHGHLPTLALLQRHNLVEQFEGLSRAVRTGDLRLFDLVLGHNQAFYLRKEIFLLIQLQLRNLILRSLFKKIYLISVGMGWCQEHRLQLSLVEAAMKSLGVEDADLDEAECLAANLIYTGLIRGYISHEKRLIVLSKKMPFPPPHSVL